MGAWIYPYQQGSYTIIIFPSGINLPEFNLKLSLPVVVLPLSTELSITMTLVVTSLVAALISWEQDFLQCHEG